ncbi:ABC transporter permease [Pseudalkalibacillus berkeleyi]|uniref:ABC transporter permease n=1 Tax=Pseudalkalibacillus berkeleyi TaxID=1069813 RepID=A0ABS9GXA2_9BACL|nr:ABC transporter permease [Pseudalkalibacillus berkeleyi]MCF6137319.1 ABC transporter permease [Pseudalkalibacillus berkeleyi]
MIQWFAVFKRENLENWRNFKWIWVPIIFIILGVMDPITTYYLPKIIDAVGGLPEGGTITLPEYSPVDILMASLGQYSQLGVLIIVLMTMGVIARERRSGIAELILVKPVKYSSYVSAKWSATALLVIVSLTVGLLMSWYYTGVLFGALTVIQLIQALFFYSLWLILVVSISIFMNTLVKNSGVVAFLTITAIIVMSILTSIFKHQLIWSPNRISDYIRDTLYTGVIPNELWGTSIVTTLMIFSFIIGSVLMLRNKEMS